MDALECIKSRRSIRRFTDQKLSDDIINQLLEAIRWSPSWANTQCWEVIVVKDPDMKQKVADCLQPNNPATKGVLQAPLLMIMCARLGAAGFKKGEMLTDKGDWYMFDAGIASQNLCLAAHSMGLGTVHVGSIKHAELDAVLGLPENIKSIEVIPVGYPAKEATAPARKELGQFVHLNQYGQPL